MVIGNNGMLNIASADVAHAHFWGAWFQKKKKKKNKHKQEPCVRQCVLFQDSPENLWDV
jgi:hypothetical protein